MPADVDDLMSSGSPLCTEEMSNDVEVRTTSLRLKAVDDLSCLYSNEQQPPSEVGQDELKSNILRTPSSNLNKNNGRTRDAITTRQPHSASLHMDADANAPHEYSAVNPASGAGNSEWRDHRNHTSSDSGRISDNINTWSSKDDDTVLESAALNYSLSGRLQDVSLLENRVSSSLSDEIYQESRLSSISSQTTQSTSDENEPSSSSSSSSKRSGSRGSRSMKAIPARFLALLRSAAEHAARQRIRLEGCPLIVQIMPQNNCNVYHGRPNDQLMFVQPMYQTEFTGDTCPCASSWYSPGDYRYVQKNQYQQSTDSYAQIQYHLVHEGFMQGHYFVQSPDSFHQEDSIPLNLGFQNPFSEDSERNLKPSSYNEISPSEHFGTDHQYGSHDYHSFTYAMPIYTIPAASTNGNCIMNSAYDANYGIIA